MRKDGYSLSDLAKELNINRRTIYNWFQTSNLRSDVIYRIGYVIRHDFSKEFPELFTKEDFKGLYTAKISSKFPSAVDSDEVNRQWMEKYVSLLEKYNKALGDMSADEQVLN
ncbi:helix-turn-helix domain-containing protein [Mucilaginibacter sp.]|uniref:helix-turn-helix domain-containing protein n=1 Tax=Mucilaginibacter sp. TaxID=1882438 RepID=UPI003562DDEF